ncbi:MAG TPA: hypothetical protein VI078_12005 [bacterium]
MFVLALIAYARFARRPSGAAYVALGVVFGLGLLAKPMAVTLPFVLLLLDYWRLGRLTRPGAAAALVTEKIPLFALAAVSAVTTLIAQTKGGWTKLCTGLLQSGRVVRPTGSGQRGAAQL